MKNFSRVVVYGGSYPSYSQNFSQVYPRVVVYNRNFAELPDTPEKKEALLYSLGGLDQSPRMKDEKDEKGRKWATTRLSDARRVLNELKTSHPETFQELRDNPDKFNKIPKDIVVDVTQSGLKEGQPFHSASTDKKRKFIADNRARGFMSMIDNAYKYAKGDPRTRFLIDVVEGH